jgi:Zn-dependent M28 family amino/carboxypeptidase
MSGPRHRWIAAPIAALTLLVAGCGGDDEVCCAPPDQGAFDADRAFADVREQVEIGPRPAGSPASRRLTEDLATKLRDAGAEDVSVQAPLRNVVGVLPGTEPGYIVIGAHHDTKNQIPGFVGANDGASGVAVVLELARSLPRPFPGPSIAIALFDGEEARGSRPFEFDGKRGSTQYVELAERGAEGSPPLDEIEAMVLFDMVGDCDLDVPYEPNSDQSLYELFSEADPDTFAGRTTPIGDDHEPFLERGVPAVDLIDFDFGPGPTPGAWWHTREDTIDKVCPESLDAIGEAALEALPRIG